MRLRPYQTALKNDIYRAWQAGARNVLAVAPTGAGKTILFSEVIQEHRGASIALAHRHELVTQISMALARCGVRHRLIGASSLPRVCTALHMGELGRSYYDPTATCAVAGVDTLVRMPANDPFFASVTLGIGDECHHFLTGNKWGKTAAMFPAARWLGVTATPTRADGRGLGRHADGIFDTMVEAPGMRDLITMGYLTDYRLIVADAHVDLSNVAVSDGDYSPVQLREAVHKSRIVGDVVQSYLQFAVGKLGVTFAVDVESAVEIAAAFRAWGVPAEVVTAQTAPAARAAILGRFARREVMQLVNVDLFGEGFDLPTIEVVSFARPTLSFGLYVQQFGRALRLMVRPDLASTWDTLTDDARRWHIANSEKPAAIIIDHVGNLKHGLPDARREWSLDRRERRTRGGMQEGVIPVRACVMCAAAYERIYAACPYCGHVPEPIGRSGPEQVDGAMMELSPDALARIRGELAASQVLRVPYGAAPEVVGAVTRRHYEKQQAQAALSDTMARWGGARTYGAGETIDQAQRRFYHTFGIDIHAAQMLNRADSEALRERVEKWL